MTFSLCLAGLQGTSYKWFDVNYFPRRFGSLWWPKSCEAGHGGRRKGIGGAKHRLIQTRPHGSSFQSMFVRGGCWGRELAADWNMRSSILGLVDSSSKTDPIVSCTKRGFLHQEFLTFLRTLSPVLTPFLSSLFFPSNNFIFILLLVLPTIPFQVIRFRNSYHRKSKPVFY